MKKQFFFFFILSFLFLQQSMPVAGINSKKTIESSRTSSGSRGHFDRLKNRKNSTENSGESSRTSSGSRGHVGRLKNRKNSTENSGQKSSFFREFFKKNMNKLVAGAPEFIQKKLTDPAMHRNALNFLIKKSTHYLYLYWGIYTPQQMSEFWDLYNAADLISKQ